MSVSSKDANFDLIAIDLPEEVLVPNVSFPPSSIRTWNVHDQLHVKVLFNFLSLNFMMMDACLYFYPKLKLLGKM